MLRAEPRECSANVLRHPYTLAHRATIFDRVHGASRYLETLPTDHALRITKAFISPNGVDTAMTTIASSPIYQVLRIRRGEVLIIKVPPDRNGIPVKLRPHGLPKHPIIVTKLCELRICLLTLGSSSTYEACRFLSLPMMKDGDL